MAVTARKLTIPMVAASVVGEGMAVAFASGAAAFLVSPASGLTDRPIAGLAEATAATPGQSLNVIYDGVGKAWAAGSIANGKPVCVGSINGALIQFTPSPATAGNSQRYGVGVALANAGAGDRFPVLIQPFSSL